MIAAARVLSLTGAASTPVPGRWGFVLSPALW
jgi:hypothetical protein